MTYNFDEIIDRRATPCIKWHWYGEEALPLWVADMDFASPEPVLRALRDRVAHGVFGYEKSPAALREVLVARLKRLYAWEVAPEAIIFMPGVVTGFHLATQAFVAPTGGLLFQTPVYPPICEAAQTCGVLAQGMELTRRSDGQYEIDFDRLTRTLTADTQLFLLCNPHNPVGRVFRRAELEQMAELCLRQEVIICSDEIHGDLIFSGHQHLPMAALAPEIAARTITLMAPSKTYNIAGLHCSFAVIQNPELRQRFQAARRGLVDTVNLLAYTAALAAYQEGDAWLAALLVYLEANRDFLCAYVREHLPGISVACPEGTYLAWLDCRALRLSTTPHEFFLQQAHVVLNDGATFGPGGAGFARLNFGCPRATLVAALERMRASLQSLA